MYHLLLPKTSAYLLILLLTLTLAAKAIGTLQPPNPTLRGFTEGCKDKQQPCWYGILLGVTTSQEARTIIENSDLVIDSAMPNSLRIFSIENDLLCDRYDILSSPVDAKVTNIYLQGCKNIHLRDILKFACCPDGYFSAIDGNVWIRTLDGQIALWSPNAAKTTTWTLTTNITKIWLSVSTQPVEFKWHGFVSQPRYCQLEPNFTYC